MTHCDEEGVTIDGARISTATVIWAAGVAASPVGRWLNEETDKAGRVRVRPDLSTQSDADIFVIGDAALVISADGTAVPGIAPAAKQQGRFVSNLIAARLKGESHAKPFRYRHAGHLATIGRTSAVIEFPHFKMKGWLAWWLWGIAHIYFLVGVPSPLVVSIRWLWQYVTYGRGARLITGVEQSD